MLKPTEPDYPIRPEHIDLSNGIRSRMFGSSSLDDVAEDILAYCQARRRGWAPFTRVDLEEFFVERNADGILQLLHYGCNRELLVRMSDGSYVVTHHLVAHAFVDYPARVDGVAVAEARSEHEDSS